MIAPVAGDGERLNLGRRSEQDQLVPRFEDLRRRRLGAEGAVDGRWANRAKPPRNALK